MITRVKNVDGTSYSTPPSNYASWLDFWEQKSGLKSQKCGNCSDKALLGGHVIQASATDNKRYIVPLCMKCNKISSNETFKVDTVLIEINE